MTWPGGAKEQKALLDRVMPMVRKIAKKRARLGRVLAEDECLDVARWAAEDALATYDREKGELAGYVHAKVDQALLNAIARKRRRESLPIVEMIRAMYARARELKQRGNLMHDSDEETLNHLHDASEELAGTFGMRLCASAEEVYATSEEARTVRGALDEMTEYEKRILWARFVEEKTLEDIAEVTRTSIATVHRDLPKALVRLMALLRRKGVDGRPNDEQRRTSGEGGGPPAASGASSLGGQGARRRTAPSTPGGGQPFSPLSLLFDFFLLHLSQEDFI